MRNEFAKAILANQAAFDLSLSDVQIEQLADYYDLILEHNPLLHLVAPCSPEEFAVRHILESLTLIEYLRTGAKFADVGTGAGLPSIPCLLVRSDLKVTLIESKEKKSTFLEIAITALGLADRSKVVNRQFEETNAGNCEIITCRALDKFTEKLPRLIKWSGRRDLLLFGGPALGKALSDRRARFSQRLLPLSDQRFLFIVNS